MDNWTVYKHTLPDGKVYIGITSLSPKERWDDGFGYLKQHSFFKYIVKFGWDILDRYIDFRYVIDSENLEMITIRVPIPDTVTYSGLYDYLCWKLNFNDVEVSNSLIVDREIFTKYRMKEIS